MRQPRLLIELVRADFLERTRRYSFLITVGIMLYVGYMAVPPLETAMLTVNLGNMGGLRGIYNAAWIGSMIALLSSMVLSLPGFYLVKNAISRDRETGVGQIIATTPLSKVAYILGKLLSNFVFLVIIIGAIVMMAGLTQRIRGEAMRIDLLDLLAPFFFTTLPTMLLVAALALLFESIPFLRGGFGNIIYFVLYIAAIGISMSGVQFTSQGVIDSPINDLFGVTVIGASMLQAAHAVYPARTLNLGIGYTLAKGPIDTFVWEGVTWTPDVILQRLLWVGAAFGIALLAALFFDRFDPARSSRRQDARSNMRTRMIAPLRSLRLPIPNLSYLLTRAARTLPPSGRVLLAELHLMLKGMPWWWYLVTAGLIIAGASADDLQAQQGILLAAWIWPVLVWSKLGVRESLYHTKPIIFSTPHPLQRQFPAMWLAGVLITLLSGSGVGMRWLVEGTWSPLLAWGIAVLFIPTLALALGVWSGSSKTFEAAYIAGWYIGPVSKLAALDFMGVSQAARAANIPFITLGITALLLGAAFIGRQRQIYR